MSVKTIKMVEIKEKEIETVEDMINALLQVPKSYKIHPMGINCKMAVNHYNQCIYLDDPRWIDEIEYDVRENIKYNGDEFEMKINKDMLETYKWRAYVLIGYSDLSGNGNLEAKLCGVFSTLELADKAGAALKECNDINYYEIQIPSVDEFWKDN